MSNENKVDEFNQFFASNYKYLLSFSKSIDAKNDYQNLLHTVYLKCHDRIKNNGFQGNGYLNYTRCALMNYFKSEYRLKQKAVIVDVDDENYHSIIDDILQKKEELQEQDEISQHKMAYLVNGIYEYLDQYYDDKHKFVFKTYYLLKHKHLNYKQLADATGYSITSVSNIIKRIKKDLRYNLLTFLKTGINMDQLLEETKAMLCKDVNTHWTEYLQLYQKLFGKQYRGCKCKSSKVKAEIELWYNKNKV